MCLFTAVVYVFDAQSGKPLGDGKPITHKVRRFTVNIQHKSHISK